ncbi:MAG TPA: hypothetical protein G4O17_03770 [Dehalococcoidia bacterium]|nr:hypothetical protein [Dehalococcoidia bacterium]
MKFLKVLALSLISSLLVLSLFAFGIALTLNYTLLNPDFIVSEVDKVDISSLVEEFISEEISEEELPEELRVVLVDTVTKLEPVVKERANATIYPIFDYLLGKSQSPDLALTLRNTFLNSEFVVSVLDELDVSSLAEELLTEEFIEEIPEEMEYLVEYMDDIVAELEPWAKEQVSIAADPVFDYLVGESQSLNVVISLEPVMESLEDTLREAFLESPPSDLSHLPQAELELYFDVYFQELTETMPSTFEINESLLGTEVPAEIAEALAETEGALEQARQYIGYFQLGYKILIGFTLLLILGIVLINRQVKGATRGIGIPFLTCGALSYIGILIAKNIIRKLLMRLDIPAQFQPLLPQLLSDFLAPLQWFSLGLFISGIALIIVSFIYKPRQPSF